jgi:putative transposase
MSREARVVAEGVPHHITQRGNNRQDVFLLDEDRRFYIEALRAKSQQHGLAILGYCLMTNHVHLIAVPRHAASLARAIGQTHWRCTMRFNKKYGRSGHLWQNRFYSCLLGPTHLVSALAYVDLNPVRAGLVGRGPQYPWSSAAAHGSGTVEDPLIDSWAWSETGLASDWEERLQAGSAGARDVDLRRATYSGLPFGDEKFVEKMESRLGRRLHPKPPGRAPKALQMTAGGL